MTIGNCAHDPRHLVGDSATRPIEPRCGTLAALLLLAGISPRSRSALFSAHPRALQAHRITAHSDASNCRF